MKTQTIVKTDVLTAVPDVERPALHLLDDPIQVDAWLASLGPEDRAGVCRDARDCPLASYLHAQNPEASDWGVGGPGYALDDQDYVGDDWVAGFVRLVDDEPTSEVTAERAREILAHVIDPAAPFTPPSITYDELQEQEDEEYDDEYDGDEDEDETQDEVMSAATYYFVACTCAACVQARDVGAMSFDP